MTKGSKPTSSWKQDMNQAFTIAGWEDFADIVEPGSQLLTIEFLISFTIEETRTKTKVYFRFFNEQFEMTLQQFSVALGFNKRCILDPTHLLSAMSMTVALGGV